MTATRLGSLLALLAVSLGLTACGGGGVTQTLDPVAAAATKTQGAGGVKMKLSVTVTGSGRTVAATGNGAFDNDKGFVDFDLGSLLEQAGAPAGSGSRIRVLFVTESGDHVLYLHMPFLSGVLPGGRAWVKLDLDKASGALGVNLQKALGSSATQNPADALSLLQAHGTFTNVGPETIDGVDTTHYQGTIDLRKAAAANDAAREAVQRLIAAGAPAELPVDAWIDGSGYLRRIKESYGTNAGATPSSEQVTVDLTDYGTSVDVQPPPDDEVFDATGAAVQAIGSQSGATTVPAPTTTG